MKQPVQRPLKLPSRSARVQAESKDKWNEARSAERADFFTIGYAGRTAKQLIERMIEVGVCSVLDIRFNPVSMYRPELNKANFQREAERAGLQYVHARELGVPREIRARALATGDRQAIWDWYDKHVVARFVRNFHNFFNIVEHPVALMCVEADPTECHRHLLFQALEENGLRGFDL
jgi:uncharacterized protein (DUF488 family)